MSWTWYEKSLLNRIKNPSIACNYLGPKQLNHNSWDPSY